jgi:hypothetical protein
VPRLNVIMLTQLWRWRQNPRRFWKLTENDFQDAFKIWQTRWERWIRAEGEYFEGDGGQKAQS